MLFVLTLTSNRAVLNGNVEFSILVLSTKIWYSSFLKKVFRFTESIENIQNFSDCHIKTLRSFKRKAFLKVIAPFLRSYALSVGFKMKPL